MDRALSKLFTDFDRGTISRRQLLQALGIVAATVPMSAFGQGRCGGARAGTPECDTTPAKAPFEPTGWKTVSLDHFNLQCVDPKREAAYYVALMNWKVRSDDGSKIVLDIGDDVGSVIITGGYQPPPPPPPPPAGDSAAGGGGRGGGRGGQRAPRNAVWNSFCWGIEPWDTKKVEAELKKRGLNPVAEHDGDFQAFHVKDPDGFDLAITNGSKKRRRTPPSGSLSTPAPFEHTGFKTVWLDHISFQSGNYKEGAAFYEALLGWKGTGDEGSQNTMEIGDVGGIIIRGGNPAAGRAGGAGGGAPQRRGVIDHISFGLAAFDPDAVKAELDKRGLNARVDTGGRGDIHEAPYKSYHTTTPDGFDLQISNTTRATREVR